ncbi:GNAT family N-acetyltransferase [Pseudovibrio sp. JE062]|uniref:GNAT family N-acetyltransferase n=1 Tax=Pseudovibrio sp. JE062 TaxID=439495 RepID=UPI000186F640|nr:GNAT family N-acetyltransferase [Pseudovibrio sp. JE062]EEA93365.1 GCN5-related N-acetyltransferase [Pseudovibrio sp. JE062]
MSVMIRPLEITDAPHCAQIYYDAIMIGAKDYYTTEQLNAWAGPQPNPEGWTKNLDGMTGFVAIKEDAVIGFMTIDMEGYIKFAFVSPFESRNGVATAIYNALLNWAIERNISALSSDISLAAKPFFLRQDWQVVRQQAPVCRGITLTNFHMTKALTA